MPRINAKYANPRGKAFAPGNFDSQLISVGMPQWNYGAGNRQPVLEQWRDSFGSRR